jgi:HEPN domain-containing protein
MKDRFDLTRGFLLIADSDLSTGKLLISAAGPYDTACFHAQQAAEKYLKSLFTFFEKPIPRTHNLEELQVACSTLSPAISLAGLNLAELTPYAVELRYDLGVFQMS